jgi:2-oxo-4-hydroxy-4-carboxy-5-ureidoimidazoline decarboxylase
MTLSKRKVSLALVNSMSHDEFVDAIGPVFEGPPWIAEAAWARAPFIDAGDLYAALCDVMYAATTAQQEELIRAHPDLVGRAALAGTLGRESTQEQAAAGLNTLSPEEIERFNALNKEYRERFDFPFVICARENKKESIMAGFAARMHNSREAEIAAALHEISKIARLRLADLLEGST